MIIEEFAHEFQQIRRKIDPKNTTPREGVIRDFLERVNPQIKLLTIASKPRTLQDAIATARTIEVSMPKAQGYMAEAATAPLIGLVETIEVLTNEIKELKENAKPKQL